MNEIEKWEFGSLEWCKFAAETGVKLIKQANLDLNKYEWGFSEDYIFMPKRLLAGRERADWHFMIHNGKVSGGASLPIECLELSGFHAVAEWALIAHASSFIYDLKGQNKRFKDEETLNNDLTMAGKERKTKSFIGKPVWPPGIGEALMGIGGEGLHNITARRLKHSPEVSDFPHTEYGVPILTEMTNEQKTRFYKLLGR
ncbi:hypothetical protein LCGC14_1439290 [marine sediment metagenome]|uniref:Uncharacterized protein n=1 Tax=marine sediment metagenome TaxID=412755 RepID=A0A0F9M1Q2_9ZZZZ